MYKIRKKDALNFVVENGGKKEEITFFLKGVADLFIFFP